MPKVKTCFICGVIDKEDDKSLFNVPSGKFEEWQKIIVKPGLTKASKLCESHFEENEIHKGHQVGNDFVPATRNRLLTKDVVPTKNLGVQSSLCTDGCQAMIPDVSRSSSSANEQENELFCDNIANEVEIATSKGECNRVTAHVRKSHHLQSIRIQTATVFSKYSSITSRKRNVFRKISPDSCINCSKNFAKVAKLKEKMEEKDKTIRRLRQQNAHLVSFVNDVAGKIEQFKAECPEH